MTPDALLEYVFHFPRPSRRGQRCECGWFGKSHDHHMRAVRVRKQREEAERQERWTRERAVREGQVKAFIDWWNANCLCEWNGPGGTLSRANPECKVGEHGRSAEALNRALRGA